MQQQTILKALARLLQHALILFYSKWHQS